MPFNLQKGIESAKEKNRKFLVLWKGEEVQLLVGSYVANDIEEAKKALSSLQGKPNEATGLCCFDAAGKRLIFFSAKAPLAIQKQLYTAVSKQTKLKFDRKNVLLTRDKTDLLFEDEENKQEGEEGSQGTKVQGGSQPEIPNQPLEQEEPEQEEPEQEEPSSSELGDWEREKERIQMALEEITQLGLPRAETLAQALKKAIELAGSGKVKEARQAGARILQEVQAAQEAENTLRSLLTFDQELSGWKTACSEIQKPLTELQQSLRKSGFAPALKVAGKLQKVVKLLAFDLAKSCEELTNAVPGARNAKVKSLTATVNSLKIRLTVDPIVQAAEQANPFEIPVSIAKPAERALGLFSTKLEKIATLVRE